MHPVLFTVGKFTAYSYGLMIGIGAVLGILLSELRAYKRGMEGDVVFNATLYGLIAGLVGAKLTFVLSNIKYLFSDPKTLFGTDGFVVYGGVIIGVGFGYWYLKHKKVESPAAVLDLVIPQIALAQGFGRIGCFLAGCCYGKPTTSAFGVIFSSEAVAPSGIPLWPTQLFSSAGNFLIFAILLIISVLAEKKGRELKPLSLTGGYLCLYGIGRFLIEFLRADPRKVFFGLSSNQWVSILFLILGLYLLFRPQRAEEAKEEKIESES